MGGGGGHASSMADLFDMMSGGGGGGRRRGPEKGEPIVHKLKSSLREMYNGATRKLALTRKARCVACKGTGTKSGRAYVCKTCNGTGIQIHIRQLGPGMIQQMQSKCSACDGTGEMIPADDMCKKCNGKKFVTEKKIFEVDIEAGMKHGQKIVMRGEAGYTQPGVAPGDLVFILEQKEHDFFTRKGADLLMTKEITLTEALCGYKFEVEQLDGRKLVVTQKPGDKVTKPDSWKCVNDEGMPVHQAPFQKGNLYINLQVKFPEKISPSECAKLRSILPQQCSYEEADEDSDDAMEDQEEDVEHAKTRDVNIEQELRNRKDFGKAHNYNDSSDDEGGMGGQRVQCHQQ